MIRAIRWADAQRLEKERELVGTYHSANPLDPYYMELNFGCLPLKSFAEMAPVEGAEVTVGGMVTEFSERTGKSGNKFGIFKIQDYTGSHEFMVFSNDFYKYRNYGQPGTPLLIRGTFGKRFQSSTEIRFSINSISLLEEIKGRIVSGITIDIPTDQLNETLGSLLADHAKSSDSGLGQLRFRIIDPKTNRAVSLDSPIKIPVNKELIEILEDMNLAFKVERAG